MGGPARFLVQPRAVIIDVVAAMEPALAPEVVEAVVDRVADTRAKQRRLAQALEEDPELLISGRPAGPRLVELLIRGLLPQGASRLVLPRCADCGRPNDLKRTDGDRRLCAACGRTLKTVARDEQGRPRCYRHRPVDDGTAAIQAVVERLDTGLAGEEIRSLIQRSLGPV